MTTSRALLAGMFHSVPTFSDRFLRWIVISPPVRQLPFSVKGEIKKLLFGPGMHPNRKRGSTVSLLVVWAAGGMIALVDSQGDFDRRMVRLIWTLCNISPHQRQWDNPSPIGREENLGTCQRTKSSAFVKVNSHLRNKLLILFSIWQSFHQTLVNSTLRLTSHLWHWNRPCNI